MWQLLFFLSEMHMNKPYEVHKTDSSHESYLICNQQKIVLRLTKTKNGYDITSK